MSALKPEFTSYFLKMFQIYLVFSGSIFKFLKLMLKRNLWRSLCQSRRLRKSDLNSPDHESSSCSVERSGLVRLPEPVKPCQRWSTGQFRLQTTRSTLQDMGLKSDLCDHKESQQYQDQTGYHSQYKMRFCRCKPVYLSKKEAVKEVKQRGAQAKYASQHQD